MTYFFNIKDYGMHGHLFKMVNVDLRKEINKIKDKYRFQIVCRFSTERENEIINKIFRIVEEIQDKNIQIFIETNPQNLS